MAQHPMKVVLLDLDGTLTKSDGGIIASVVKSPSFFSFKYLRISVYLSLMTWSSLLLDVRGIGSTGSGRRRTATLHRTGDY